ncbi:MAG: penicillin acylase family protein [Polyangiaceae bacterium]|nr:penicillin acylase family protein [Polyangiaceae bacterium]
MRRVAWLPLLLGLSAQVPACGGEGDTTTSPPAATPSTLGPLGERADLPVDETITLQNLSAPVDVVRDKFGRPHVYASTVADAMRVEGFLIAKDRHLQLELLRRVSEGRVAEMLGDADPSLVDTDIGFRTVGLHRVAKQQYAALPADGELKQILDAYADGVTQAYRGMKDGSVEIPPDIGRFLKGFLTDWDGADSLAMGRLQTWLLSYGADGDIDITAALGALQATFTASAGDPSLARRAGLERDLIRLAPADPATSRVGFPTAKSAKRPLHPRPSFDAAARLRPVLAAMKKAKDLVAPEGFGSNNWAVSAAKSTTGHALVASDPHLNLSAPAVFYPIDLEVRDADPAKALSVSGLAFPGIPGIILGRNQHLAWGATVAGYDVSDAYAETLTADGQAVKWKGQDVPLQTIEETIAVAGGAPVVYKVRVVPHHGPIQPVIREDHTVADPDPKTGAVSIRWTGHEPTEEIAAVVGLLRAKNVDEAKVALTKFGVGAQNWMIGDVHGDILWTSHAIVPVRDPKALAWDPATYRGTLPCLVLPGDGSADWTGNLPDDLVPWEKNPAAGWISTANNDAIGTTLDNDPSNDLLPDGTPGYLACSYDIGFREGRIHALLGALDKVSPEDMARIQGDHRSPMGAALAPKIVEALGRAEEEKATPGAHKDLAVVVADPAYDPAKIALAKSLLEAWGKDSDYSAEKGIDDDRAALPFDQPAARASAATLLFNVWVVRVLPRVFGDELDRAKASLDTELKAKALLRLYGATPSELATFDAKVGDSALWDDLATPEAESRDDRTVRAVLDALAFVDKNGGLEKARWGSFHTVRFASVVPVFNTYSIPRAGTVARHGDNFVVDASAFGVSYALTATPKFSYSSGPTQRMVADLDPAGPKVTNALPGGNVWDPDSPHFEDEAAYWLKNQTHPIPATIDEVVAAKERRSTFRSK